MALLHHSAVPMRAEGAAMNPVPITTGVTVRPKVYIACGISGAIQHVAGMKESGIVISINTDPNAPINTIADYIITGRVEDVVPKMIKYYKENSK